MYSAVARGTDKPTCHAIQIDVNLAVQLPDTYCADDAEQCTIAHDRNIRVSFSQGILLLEHGNQDLAVESVLLKRSY